MQSASSAYRPSGHARNSSARHYYTTTPSTGQRYTTTQGYQTPSTYYPTSPSAYSRVTTATPGLSSYSGYVFDPYNTNSTSLAPPPPLGASIPPGRAHTASTRRSSRRTPMQYAAGLPSYAPSAASRRAAAMQPYPFHMAAYGPQQPHVSATAPTAVSSAIRPSRTPTNRLSRRPSQANLHGHGRSQAHAYARPSASASAGGGGYSRTGGRRTICSVFGRQLAALADVWAGLFGLGPTTAARRVASAAAKLNANPVRKRRDAQWRAQLEEVICRECDRLLDYAQSHVYSTQMQSLDALNALANEYHVVLRCLARIDGARKLDRVSEIIRLKRAKLRTSDNNNSASAGARYSRDQIHQLRVRCSTLKQRLRYRNRERKSE